MCVCIREIQSSKQGGGDFEQCNNISLDYYDPEFTSQLKSRTSVAVYKAVVVGSGQEGS